MLPKIGEFKAVLHRYFEGTLKTAAISKLSTGDIL
jgi:putative transposase